MEYLFLSLIAAHWVADFVLQNDRVALRKSSNWLVLGQHVLIYTVAMTVALIAAYFLLVEPAVRLESLALFAGITFVAHFITDAITSRVNAALWQAERRHDFFVAVGFDQLLHYLQLFFTLKWVFTGSVF